MRNAIISLLFTSLLGVCPAQTQSLFDGKSLTGWDGNPAFWRVEKGVIVGETTASNPTKGNSFLIWKGGELKDFELTLKARVLGNNSGVQYRSKVVDPKSWAVGGYQMDLIGNHALFAMLYEERGRGILAQRGQRVVLRADQKPQVIGEFDKSKALDVAQWNEYKIVAKGRILRHAVNGDVTVEVIDDDVAKRSLSGVLAIQLHAGPPTRVEVKDIVLKPLSAKESAAPVATPAPSAPQWIWTTQTAKTETIYARRQWTLRGGVKKAVLRISCDNGYTAFVNGKQVGTGSTWAQPGVYDVTTQLRSGDNVIAVEATNEGSLAGLVARLDLTDAAGKSTSLVTDSDWNVRGDKVAGWMAPSEDPKGWSRPHLHGALGMAPWGNVFNPKAASKPTAKPPVASKPAPKPIIPAVPEGFEVDLVYTVPKATQGSWVAMAVDDKGRLYCCDQGKAGIFRLTLGGAQPVVEKVPVDLSGAQGLLWANGVLYAALNTSKPVAGLYRVSDTNGDDTLDRVELLREMRQGGEHGIHGVVLGPDGKSLYLAGGNHSPIPSPETSSVPRNYDEDQLLPRMIDSRGMPKA